MRAAIVLPLWLASLAAGSPVERRQSGGLLSTLAGMLPASYSVAPSSVQDAKPQLRSTAQRKIARYGPFKLPANKDTAMGEVKPMEGHSHGGPGMGAAPGAAAGARPNPLLTGAMDPNGFSITKMMRKGSLCNDCTVLAGKMTVVFENGTRADIGGGVYLHHSVAIDISKKIGGFVSACPPGANAAINELLKQGGAGGVNTFIGGAVDEFTQFYTTPDGKFNSGYYIKDNDFALQAEIINYRSTEQSVYIQTDLEYLPGKVGSDAEQGILSAVGCDGKNLLWKPAKNTVGKVVTDGYEVYRDGHIVLARGHMHDGGTGMNMYINGNLYCASKALYGGPGGTITVNGKSWSTIATMTECNEPVAVKKGDKIKLEATYDTKEHPLRESHGVEQENMGIMTMVFAPALV